MTSIPGKNTNEPFVSAGTSKQQRVLSANATLSSIHENNSSDEDDVPVVRRVTSNDRLVQCPTNGGCGDAAPGGGGGGGGGIGGIGGGFGRLAELSRIKIDATFIDVAELENKLDEVSRRIDVRIDDYKTWLREQEALFEAKYYMEHISVDNNLFNRVNNVIGRLKQGLKILNRWYTMMRNTYAEINDVLFKYKTEKNALEANIDDYSCDSGMSINAIAAARKKEARSKSIAKQITRIRASQTELERLIMIYQAELSAFERNNIRINNSSLDMLQLSKEIESLSDNSSPLVRVQEDLAARINSILIRHTLNTNDATLNRFSAVNLNFQNLPRSDDYVNTDQLVQFLDKIKNSYVYTNNTRARIEKILDYAVNAAQGSENEDVVLKLRNDIRNNTPDRVIEYLQTLTRGNTVYECMSKGENFINNLTAKDAEIYKPLFQRLLNECRNNAQEQINNINV